MGRIYMERKMVRTSVSIAMTLVLLSPTLGLVIAVRDDGAHGNAVVEVVDDLDLEWTSGSLFYCTTYLENVTEDEVNTTAPQVNPCQELNVSLGTPIPIEESYVPWAIDQMTPLSDITVTLTWKYYDPYYNQDKYIKGARCILMQGDSWLQNKPTNSNGQVSFTMAPGTYRLQIRCDDETLVKVRTGDWFGDATYRWILGPYSFTYSQSVPAFVLKAASGYVNTDVWCVYTNIRDESDWVAARTSGFRAGHVSCYYPRGVISYRWGFGSYYIDLGTEYSRLKERHMAHHEYAHHLMYWGRGQNMPGFNNVSPHYPDTEAHAGSGTNWGFSFFEGWAGFMECAVDNDVRGIGRSTLGSYGWGDVEYGGDVDGTGWGGTYPDGRGMVFADNPWNHGGNYGDWDGWDVEGAFAAVLWDTMDGYSGSDHPYFTSHGDQISGDFGKVWDVAVIHRPGNMVGYFNIWVEHWGSDRNYLNYICLNARADIYDQGDDT